MNNPVETLDANLCKLPRINVSSHRFSDQSEPNFFRMFGSGFKNGPSPLPEKYRFTRHSFPEYSRQPTQSPSRSKRNRFTFKE